MFERVTLTVLVDDEPGKGVLDVEHGFACLVETGSSTLLFDTGSHGAILPNAALLGVDLTAVEVVVLSHGHYDHVGGLVALNRYLGTEIRVVAHPAFDASHRSRSTGRDQDIGVTKHVRWALARARVERHREPTEILPGVWTTGEIPRLLDEKLESPFFRDPEATIPDLLEDDQALVVQHRAGLVVLLGCAHAGVVGTVRHVRALFPSASLLALAGGMHLQRADEQRIEWTIRALTAEDVRVVAPGHCTGRRAKDALRNAFGPRFREVTVGTRIDLEESHNG